MLTKSQAKAFFIVGTAAFSAIFIGLTVDTFQRIPAQTKSQDLTEEVIRGKHLFDSKNCMGCHTIMGEGAYYAPELTKVYERRGEAFIKAMLKDPEAMYPGQRKMTNYHLNDQEINDLAAFLIWVGKMDLNGFPPKPDLIKVASPEADGSSVGEEAIVKNINRPQVFNQMCIACHKLSGQGGEIGPALDGVGSRFDVQYLTTWLKDPMSIKSDSKMPKLPLSDEEISELAAFLSTLKEKK
ncbi:MAG: c-type cytochrome [Bdellovibrionales bacterium]|nr:c-type cytochrome [Bdellovibrionales bacterium]